MAVGPTGTFIVLSSAHGQASQGDKQGAPFIKELCIRETTSLTIFKALYDRNLLSTVLSSGSDARPAGAGDGATIVYTGTVNDPALLGYEAVPVKQP